MQQQQQQQRKGRKTRRQIWSLCSVSPLHACQTLRTHTAPSNPAIRNAWGGGRLISDKRVWHVDTFKNCGGCITSPGVQEGAAKTRQRELRRGDDGIFQSSAPRWISAPPRPPHLFHISQVTFPPCRAHLLLSPPTSLRRSSEPPACTFNAARYMREHTLIFMAVYGLKPLR